MDRCAPINRGDQRLETNGILPGWHGIRPAAEMEARLGIPCRSRTTPTRARCGRSCSAPAATSTISSTSGCQPASAPGSSCLAGRITDRSASPARSGTSSATRGDRSVAVATADLETIASPVAVAALLERSMNRHPSVNPDAPRTGRGRPSGCPASRRGRGRRGRHGPRRGRQHHSIRGCCSSAVSLPRSAR